MPANMRCPGVPNVTALVVSHTAGTGATGGQAFRVQTAPASGFGAARVGFEPAPFAIYAGSVT